MKRMLAALVLVTLTAIIGCIGVDSPQVDPGGGERADLLLDNNNHLTGGIQVQGHVVNTGGKPAKNVVLHFTFFNAGTVYLEGELRLGEIDRGVSQNFIGTFYGPPVNVDSFTWEYRIDWD